MKVNIYETVEVSDEDRIAVAHQIDGDGAKKRQATRDELKAYIWNHGASWSVALSEGVDDAPADDEDLLGETADDEDLLGETAEDLI